MIIATIILVVVAAANITILPFRYLIPKEVHGLFFPVVFVGGQCPCG
jgi:hypothetical protein